MNKELRERALAGLMAGELNEVVPYLRSFGDGVLTMAANMIDGSSLGPRIVIDVAKDLRTQRKHDKIGVFVAMHVKNGMVLKAAVHEAQKSFGVGRSTVLAAWSDYKEFVQAMDAKFAAHREKGNHLDR